MGSHTALLYSLNQQISSTNAMTSTDQAMKSPCDGTTPPSVSIGVLRARCCLNVMRPRPSSPILKGCPFTEASDAEVGGRSGRKACSPGQSIVIIMYPRGAPEMKLTSEHCAERLLLLANTRARTNFDGRDGATRQKVSDTIYSCKFGVTFRSL